MRKEKLGNCVDAIGTAYTSRAAYGVDTVTSAFISIAVSSEGDFTELFMANNLGVSFLDLEHGDLAEEFIPTKAQLHIFIKMKTAYVIARRNKNFHPNIDYTWIIEIAKAFGVILDPLEVYSVLND